MNVLELLARHQLTLPFTLGPTLASGVDGEVFELANVKDRVLKLSVFHHDQILSPELFQVFANLDYIQHQSPAHLVKVYDYQDVYIHLTSPHYTIFWTEMEKLFPLSEDEQKVTHTILSHEDAGKPKDYNQEKLAQILAELSGWLEYDMDRMLTFCSTIRSSPVIHHDIHPRNIMKTADGDYKLVDLNRLTIKES